MNLARATAPVDLYGRHYTPGEFLPFYVPRPAMPQIDERDYARLIADAYNHPAAEVWLETIDPRKLRAHQRVDHARAQGMDDAIRAKPVIVSADNYVLDGNHRWWAHVHAGSKAMAVIRLGFDFDAGLHWLLGRPYVYTLTPDTPERN